MTTNQTHNTGFRPVLDDPSKQVVRRNGAPLADSAAGAALSALMIFTYATGHILVFFLLLIATCIWSFARTKKHPMSYDISKTSSAKTIGGYIAFFLLLAATAYLMIFGTPTFGFTLIACLLLGVMFFTITRFLMPSNYIEPVV